MSFPVDSVDLAVERPSLDACYFKLVALVRHSPGYQPSYLLLHFRSSQAGIDPIKTLQRRASESQHSVSTLARCDASPRAGSSIIQGCKRRRNGDCVRLHANGIYGRTPRRLYVVLLGLQYDSDLNRWRWRLRSTRTYNYILSSVNMVRGAD